MYLTVHSALTFSYTVLTSKLDMECYMYLHTCMDV